MAKSRRAPALFEVIEQKQLQGSSSKLVDIATNVAANSQEMSATVGMVNASVQQISAGTEENASSTEQVSRGVEEVAKMANEMAEAAKEAVRASESVAAEVKEQALAFLGRVRPEGGTDIALALRRVLEWQIVDSRPDVMLFLTDGQSQSGPLTLEALREELAGATDLYLEDGDATRLAQVLGKRSPLLTECMTIRAPRSASKRPPRAKRSRAGTDRAVTMRLASRPAPIPRQRGPTGASPAVD